MSDWLLTYSGRKFWPLAPNPDDVDLEDIVQAMSQCRFGAQTELFYSVAQHCVLVSYLAPKRDALWALMHDAAETYIGDIPTPVKKNLWVWDDADKHYVPLDVVENRILKAIATALSLPWPPPDITRPDAMALQIERNSLMPDHHDWPKKPGFGPEKIPVASRMRKAGTVATGGFIYCWDPQLAASAFMERYRELRGMA
jgi:hypothetical protein